MLIKGEARTNPNYGKSPKERGVEELLSSSFINLDKPAGPTSHQVTLWVKEILGVEKTGHSGTLDPNVSGVLPIGVNRATKLLFHLLLQSKEYVCLMDFHGDVEEAKIRGAFDHWVGEIEQMVPVMAAVKRRKRMRRIYDIEILEIEGRHVLFRAETESGTYIRTLCMDIGKSLVVGAHMTQLRRTRSSVFEEANSFILQNVLDAYKLWKENGDERIKKILLPVESGFSSFPKIVVRDSSISALCHGADLAIPGILQIDEKIKRNDKVAIISLKSELVAIGTALISAEEMYERDSGIAADVETVVMEKSTYPKMWKRD
jgi:rRNA pseudouridine synthase, putative